MEPVYKDQKRCLLLQIHSQQHRATHTIKNQAAKTPPKESKKAQITDSKEMYIYELHDKKPQIIIRNSMKCKKTQIDN